MSEQMIVQMVVAAFTMIGIIGTAAITGYVGYAVAKLNADQKTRGEAEAARAVTTAANVAAVKTALDAQGRANQEHAEAVAANVAAVKSALAESTTTQGAKLDKIGVTTEASHAFANARYGVALQETFDALARVAALTRKPEDATAAERAGKALDDHKAAQATVDAQPGVPA